MSRDFFLFFILITAGPLLAFAQPNPVLIEDTEFTLSDWELLFDSSQGYSAVESQEVYGGTSGAFRRVITSRPANLPPIPDIHIFKGGTYNPSVQGAIDGLTYRDRHAWFGGERQHKLVLRQGGKIFSASGYVISQATGLWRAVQALCLKATDFEDGDGTNPDFSSSGSVIEFGYLRQEIGSLAFEQGSDTGIDSFRFVVFPAPNTGCSGEPASLVVNKSDSDHAWSTDPVIPFDIVVSNQGDQSASSLTLTEVIPENTRFRPTLSDSRWSCSPNDNAGSTCTLSIPELPGGEFERYPFYVEVLSGTPPSWDVYNQVTLSSQSTARLDPVTQSIIALACDNSTYISSFDRCSAAVEEARNNGFDTSEFESNWIGCCIARVFLTFAQGRCLAGIPGSENISGLGRSIQRANQTADIALLHGLRDGVLLQTDGGKRLVDFFYAHTTSVAEAGVRDAAVVQQARDTYDAWLPVIEAAVAGRTSAITGEQVSSLNAFFDAVEQNTNAEFAEILRAERERVDLQSLIGGSTTEILSVLESLSCGEDAEFSTALCSISRLQTNADEAGLPKKGRRRLKRVLRNANRQISRAETGSNTKATRKRLRSATRSLREFRRSVRRVSVTKGFTVSERNTLRRDASVLLSVLRRLR